MVSFVPVLDSATGSHHDEPQKLIASVLKRLAHLLVIKESDLVGSDLRGKEALNQGVLMAGMALKNHKTQT